MPAVALKTATVLVPLQSGALSPKEGQLAGAILKEKCWLDHAIQLLEKEIEKGDTVTWSTFHASLQGASADRPTTLTQLLPLFYEKAATAAMIKHGTIGYRIPQSWTGSSCKFIQWKWPDTHGEGKFVVMFGGLHIEMAMWRTYGDYLEGSGWTNALTEAGIASSGTTDSFVKVSHLT